MKDYNGLERYTQLRGQRYLQKMLTNRTKCQTSSQNSELDPDCLHPSLVYELKPIISTEFSYLKK